MRYVLDACAIISLIREEEGCVQVRQVLEAEENICLVHALNLCEVEPERYPAPFYRHHD